MTDFKAIEQLLANGSYDTCLAKLREFLSKHPSDTHANFLMGKTYFASADFRGAIIFFIKSLQSDFKSALTHYYLGLAYERLGELEVAKAEIELAIIIDPNLKSAQKKLTDFPKYFRRGDLDKVKSTQMKQKESGRKSNLEGNETIHTKEDSQEI